VEGLTLPAASFTVRVEVFTQPGDIFHSPGGNSGMPG
jgi:hypothetical protein